MTEVDDDEKKEYESYTLSLALKYKFITPWTSMICIMYEQNDNDNHHSSVIDNTPFDNEEPFETDNDDNYEIDPNGGG